MREEKKKDNDIISVIFLGTPDFAVPFLEKLIFAKDFSVKGVITQEDKRAGRNLEMKKSPIKKIAKKHNLKIYQPKKIKNFNFDVFLKVDFLVVVAYGQIITKKILDFPKYACINVHASLLPKYRGAACIQAPILSGDKETGLTIMKMDENLDTGPILKQNKINLEKNETSQSLYERLKNLGGDFLLETLRKYKNQELLEKAQENSKASYVGQIRKEDGKIKKEYDAIKIERMTRAFFSWPGVFAAVIINNKKKNLKIIEVDSDILKINKYVPGQFFIFEKKLALQCSKYALIIKRLQMEGKKIMSADDFLKGYEIENLKFIF